MLSHKTAFSSVTGQNYGTSILRNNFHIKLDLWRALSKRVCFYCLDPGHLIADSKVWKKKNITVKPKSVANIVCEPMVILRTRVFRMPLLLLLLYSRVK